MIIRKKLMTELSAEHIRNVTETLKENNIAFDIKTIVSRPTVSQFSQRYQVKRQYLYVVYVRLRDYIKAKEILK